MNNEQERRQHSDAEFYRYLKERGVDLTSFPERRSGSHPNPGRGLNGGITGRTAMITGIGFVLLMGLLTFTNQRVMNTIFSRNPEFTQEERDRIYRLESGLQGIQEQLTRIVGDHNRDRDRYASLEKKLDRLLWKQGIDPESVR